MLDHIYYGNSLKDWLISIAIIVVAIFINKGLKLFGRKVIYKYTVKSKSSIDDIIFSSLEKPILFGVMLIAIWVALTRLDLGVKFRDIVGKSYQVLTVLNITWFIARLTSSIITDYSSVKHKERTHFDAKLIPLLRRVVLIFIWIIGIVMALNNVGVQVATLLGTLGIGGVAVALAAQDTIKNIFGGFTILTDSPFKIGDVIKFDNYEGTVQDIGIRSTRILTYEGRMITVPNYKLMDAYVTNISVEPSRRVSINLGLTYNTTPEKMDKAIEILKNIPSKVSVLLPNTIVTFSAFADSALVINYMYYIKKGEDVLGANSKVNLTILKDFNDAGLVFAFPSQTLYIETPQTPVPTSTTS